MCCAFQGANFLNAKIQFLSLTWWHWQTFNLIIFQPFNYDYFNCERQIHAKVNIWAIWYAQFYKFLLSSYICECTAIRCSQCSKHKQINEHVYLFTTVCDVFEYLLQPFWIINSSNRYQSNYISSEMRSFCLPRSLSPQPQTKDLLCFYFYFMFPLDQLICFWHVPPEITTHNISKEIETDRIVICRSQNNKS